MQSIPHFDTSPDEHLAAGPLTAESVAQNAAEMSFGPLELEACGENNFTMKALGLLAFRQDLLRRFVRHLCGDQMPAPKNDVTILFFTRIGEGFFREAIERASSAHDQRTLEARLNAELALPADFRWARTTTGRLVQPAKWQTRHIQSMLHGNGRLGDTALKARLDYIQDVLNTEPDLVLQWDDQLAIIEIKVLSGEGVAQIDRQQQLGGLLGRLLHWNSQCFFIGPSHGSRPSGEGCRFVSWADVASLFRDVPEVCAYIEQFAFFYKGKWQSMVAATATQPAPTAYDVLMSRNTAPPFGHARPGLHVPESPHSDPWSIVHLGREYFELLFERFRESRIGPITNVWLGLTGVPYIEKQNGRRINPNAMVECADGSTWVVESGQPVQGTYNNQRVRCWSYEKIAAVFDFPAAGDEHLQMEAELN